jgi:parvulin-like peptidyl-prolyl isomerase
VTLRSLLALAALAPWTALAGDGGPYAYLKGVPPSLCQGTDAAGSLRVPLFAPEAEKCPVAKVGEEYVTLGALTTALAGAHAGRTESDKAGSQVADAIVTRLVEIRLLVAEARSMGIDELPDVVLGINKAKDDQLRAVLQAQVLKDVKANPADAEKLFQEAVREWKVKSVLFYKESEAKAFVKAARGGDLARFDALAKKAIAEKKGRGGEQGQFVGASALLGPVGAALNKVKVGSVGGPVQVPEGWAVLFLEEIRYPANPKARAEAEAQALSSQQKKALRAYYDKLVKQHAKIDEKLLKKIDFDSKKPGLAALRDDKRVIVSIDGGKETITVADLTFAMETQYFHGIDRAAEEKKVNKQKGQTIDALIAAKVVPAEARRLGLDQTPAFKARAKDAEDAALFGTFIERVIVPDLKLSQESVKAYYEAHKADYMFPPFYKLEGIGFTSQAAAESALKKLRAGTDFKWLNANADDKVPLGKENQKFGGTLSEKGMPPALAKALAGSKKGDYRLYASGDQFYTIGVVSYTPAAPQPFEEVADAISKKLYGEEVTKAIKDWAEKLKKQYPVQIYLTKIAS